MGLPASRRVVEQLVDAHYQSLYRYAFRLTGSAEEAEDMTQEAFCKAQLKYAQLHEPSRVKPWLFSILRNAYLHRLRERKQEKACSLDLLGDVPEPAPEQPLPDVAPERLQELLGELPEAFRSPIVLYYFEDFSYRDIAEQMDLPLGTVMSRLSRAKAQLRGRIAQMAQLPTETGAARPAAPRRHG